MFENDDRKAPAEANTIVGPDVELVGNVKSDANIQINGKVKGKVQTENDVIVGETAVVDGSIKAKNVLVNGVIKGLVETDEDLEINPSGKVFGDIVVKNLIIKKGSIFVGKSTMGGQTEPATDGEKTKKIAKDDKLEN